MVLRIFVLRHRTCICLLFRFLRIGPISGRKSTTMWTTSTLACQFCRLMRSPHVDPIVEGGWQSCLLVGCDWQSTEQTYCTAADDASLSLFAVFTNSSAVSSSPCGINARRIYSGSLHNYNALIFIRLNWGPAKDQICLSSSDGGLSPMSDLSS